MNRLDYRTEKTEQWAQDVRATVLADVDKLIQKVLNERSWLARFEEQCLVELDDKDRKEYLTDADEWPRLALESLGVRVLGKDSVALYCLECRRIWIPAYVVGAEVFSPGFWLCPNGCNAKHLPRGQRREGS